MTTKAPPRPERHDVERLPHFKGEGTPWHIWVLDKGQEHHYGTGRWVQLPDAVGAMLDAFEPAHDALLAVRDYDAHTHGWLEVRSAHEPCDVGCMDRASLWNRQRARVVAALKVMLPARKIVEGE